MAVEPDPMKALANAQAALELAEQEADATRVLARRAVDALVEAQRARVVALRRAAGPRQDPSRLREASEVMGISVSRVYQLLRNYDRSSRVPVQEDK